MGVGVGVCDAVMTMCRMPVLVMVRGVSTVTSLCRLYFVIAVVSTNVR